MHYSVYTFYEELYTCKTSYENKRTIELYMYTGWTYSFINPGKNILNLI